MSLPASAARPVTARSATAVPPRAALTVIVLAAGEGTRMKSASTPKVLHPVAGRSLLGHVLAAVAETGPSRTGVVVGHRGDEVASHLLDIAPDAIAIRQAHQDGTGHAVALAVAALEPAGTVLVVPADAPCLRPETLVRLLIEHARSGAAATLLSSEVADPTGYGRVIRTHDDFVERVVEHADADADQQAVKEVSALVYAFDAELLRGALKRLGADNAQHEHYLPDVVSILVSDGHAVRAVLAPEDETAGVNDRAQLAEAHRVMNARIVRRHMLAGVTVIDPASTWIDEDVVIAADAVLRPNVTLHGACVIDADAQIGPDSTLTDTAVGAGSVLHRVVANKATVGAGVTVGPFAYLRPGAVLRDDAHVGTYVEIKNSEVGRATKVPHLTYMGDATVGAHSNVGAATVFVNYDGAAKHRTVVGEHVFIGSDTMLIAPVAIGDGAQTAAGSVIYQDVPPGALGVARARQRNVADWVASRRPDSKAAQAARSRSPQPATTEQSTPESATQFLTGAEETQ